MEEAFSDMDLEEEKREGGPLNPSLTLPALEKLTFPPKYRCLFFFSLLLWI